MLTAILLLITAAVAILTVVVGWMFVEDRLRARRRRKAARPAPLDVAALRALAAADATHSAVHDRLLVEIYRAQAYARFGDDITEGAPKESP